ncbi:DNA polymerase domain-containing protein [Aeromicrobium wangtongii]|uniref:DNA polymerase domain-containing protein n=1 Tax=Aeromicrobium wangtongii TaxID=2969247 RepID=A0ABY5MB37_9ACTN|nr:DNA polymerase domain-containing protein [Aeromicrobium wangtongii]MCD9197864.1 DNA polymerase domain-containing protein [Aeromicrobium wangtongii]UUP15345.1 DNA polymerase domain-containing protein [Aeromicrobium wangtongii]
MASDAVQIEAGGRSVRVSSPTRVIYEATDFSDEVTKVMIAEYYVAVADGLMRALRDRPVTLERWPKGVREGMVMSTRADSHGDAFYQKRMMKGAPDYAETAAVLFPSGRPADELCVTEIAVAAWAAHMGAITFHPWPTRRDDNEHPDELRIDLDPFGSATFADAVRVAGVAREMFAELGVRAFAKTSGKRGVHVYVRIAPEWTFTDVRHAAIGVARELEKRADGVTTSWWKEERGDRIFVDYNQNARDRTIASAYSLRPAPGATVSMPVTWDELAALEDPRTFTLHTVPDKLARDGDAWAEIDDVAHSLEPLLELWHADPTEMPYPPDYPKMPGEPKRVQPSKAKKD